MVISNVLLLIILSTFGGASAETVDKIVAKKRSAWCENVKDEKIPDTLDHKEVPESNIINNVRDYMYYVLETK